MALGSTWQRLNSACLLANCLSRRVPDELTLKRECAALQFERNSVYATVNWQFTSHDARIKLKKRFAQVEYAFHP